MPKNRSLINTLMTIQLMHFDKYKLKDDIHSRVRCCGHHRKSCKFSHGFSEQANNNCHSSNCCMYTADEIEEYIKNFIIRRDLKVKVDRLLGSKFSTVAPGAEAFKELPVTVAKRTSATTQKSASSKRQRLAIVGPKEEEVGNTTIYY